MNTGEQRELRQWADQLCEVDDPERRAMGRAIAMLLDRIDELEAELSMGPQAALHRERGRVLRKLAREAPPRWRGEIAAPWCDEQPDVVAPRASRAEPISVGEDTI